MNQQKIERFREACKYQKMAFKALFPERTARHMEVIGEELQAMLLEGMADCFREAFRGEPQERYSSKGWTMTEEGGGKTSGGSRNGEGYRCREGSQNGEGKQSGQTSREGLDRELTVRADRDSGVINGKRRGGDIQTQKVSKVKKITIG